jgi:hypothetical protein
MASPTPSLAAVLARWRSNLIDLTRRNPLLVLRSPRSSSLAISHPGVQAVFERLVQAGKTWSFWMPPPDEEEEEAAAPVLDLERIQTKANELVCGDLGRRDLLRILANLYRRSHTDYLERGLRILHVACGVLEWREEESGETLRSPLVLVPVELSRTSIREPFTLASVDEDPVLNPALQARLQQDFDFRLPTLPEDWDEKPLTAYLQEVEAAVAGLPGWRVDHTAVLTLFSFFKGVMYRDLEENAERVGAHPLVRALAGESVGAELAGEALPEEPELDAVQQPEKTFHILDADGSQRLCLEAAARGHSFVLQGPPGTGKSQTIANLIADCLATGKTVLFVSEKMAALEVVYKRLRAVGLGDYCLELHSHKANKREVVAELRRCLEERRQVDGQLAVEEAEKLKQRRDQLNAYVEALHAVREPLRQSAWWALGELSRCEGLPYIPLGLADPAELTPDWLEQTRHVVQRLQQLWHIPEQGPDFPWWGFKAEDRFTVKLRDDVSALLERVRGRIDRLAAAAEEYAGQLGADGAVPWLLRVADVLESNPRPPASWLTTGDMAYLAADLERCAADYQRRGQSREPLTARYGPDVWQLPAGTAANVEQAWRAAAPLLGPGDERGAVLLTHQQQLRGWAADTQRRIPGWISEARTLEKWLGITLPFGEGAETNAPRSGEGKDDPSVQILRRLHRLANLCVADNAPERAWVVDARALEQARNVITTARPVFAEYHRRRNDLLQRYTERYFELELDRIAEGLAGPYQSWLRMFNMQYRRDRRAIKRRSRTEELPPMWWEDVPVGRELMYDKARLETEQPERQAVLGRYEKGFDTDFDAAERATRIAAEAVELARDLDCEALPDRLVEALAAASPPSEKIRAALKRLHDSLGAWQHATDEVKAFLPMDMLPGTGSPLDESALSALMQYARDLQATLNQFAGAADPALRHARTPPADAVSLQADLRQVEDLRALEETQEEDQQRWSARLGPTFQGVSTDWNVLRKTLSWTTRLRDLLAAPDRGAASLAGPLSERFIAVVTGGASDPPSCRELRHAKEQLDQVLHSLENRFEPPAPQWNGQRLSELPADALRARVETLRQRVGELADWVDWRHVAERFGQLGLATFWDGLQKERPPRERLLDVFTKAALGGWLESVFQKEPALGGFRRQEHERVLTEFRDLDRRLIHLNAQRVAQQADSRRPETPQAIPGSEVGLLMREAHKKSKHLPVRRLFEDMSNLLLRLKPCLLMSPLSVSQYLHPEKIAFDLVVFDEASQICPEDAVVAIYRGRQAVIVGDDKQLPPTNFFQQMAADEDDGAEDSDEPAVFESVLDACLGAGLSQRMLRWHYRSRHEALIAFSNHRYYDSRLVTFPAALAGHAALGVKFHHVPDGVYDRGGRRDNLREAEVVADLVLAHAQENPAKTLGVIAFSQAQMTAIEDEIERRLRERPELEPFFTHDRLEGFFVKNLETVQGDERDVILFSVGYGRDEQGRLTMNFGPLNREGGQRRLNVAVTRAREKLVVVSSIRAGDLDLEASQAPGVHHLHQYLDYAERGIDALESTQPQGRTEPVPPLDEEIVKAIRQLGFEVLPQVGSSGFRIDLGVQNPAAPGSFVLAIEGDGPTYHAATTTRDRDRLRQEVLEKLGWRVHRIWSPDWWYRRQEEVERLREVLGEAGNVPEPTPPAQAAVSAPKPALATRKVEVGTPAENGGRLPGAVSYTTTELKVDRKTAQLHFHVPAAQKEVRRLLSQLVKGEGPIHVDVATRRLREVWQLSNTKDRIRRTMQEAIEASEAAKQLRRQGEFLWPANVAPVAVRVPEPAQPESNRDIEHIAPEELQAGMRLVVSHSGSINEEALLTQTARLFGFGKLGDTIRQRLSENLEALRQQGVCVTRSGAVTLTTG